MEGSEISQNTKKLKYHKISKSHSNATNEWSCHNNISTSPTQKVKRYTNIIPLDNNQHYSSEPKEDDHMSTDSFENQVQSTVQAITENNYQPVPMKTYIDKSTLLLSMIDLSIKYLFKTKDFLNDTHNNPNKAKVKSSFTNPQLLLQKINKEKERRKELEDALLIVRNKSNPTALSSDPIYLMNYSNYMRIKIDEITNENERLKILINKTNHKAMKTNNQKIEHFLYKETERIGNALAYINNINSTNNNNNKYNKDYGDYASNLNYEYIDDDEAKNRFNNHFRVTDSSQPDEQNLSDEAIVESDINKIEQMHKHNSKGNNKTSENSIDNIALKDFKGNNYHSNANILKMANGTVKAINYKTNSSNLSHSGNNTKPNYPIPKRFTKK